MPTSTVSSLNAIPLPPAVQQIRRPVKAKAVDPQVRADRSSDKLSPDQDAAFQGFVAELKPLAIRGEEAIRAAVGVIKRFQEKYGKSKKELTRLATAVGADVRTLYRWKAQVEGKKPETKTEPKSKNADPDQRYRSLIKAVDSIYGQVPTAEREAEINRHAQRLIQDRGNPAEFAVKEAKCNSN